MPPQSILAVDSSNPAFSRTCAEALGYLARLGDDVAAARLVSWQLMPTCLRFLAPTLGLPVQATLGFPAHPVGKVLALITFIQARWLSALRRFPVCS